jgi:hypothetical protein
MSSRACSTCGNWLASSSQRRRRWTCIGFSSQHGRHGWQAQAVGNIRTTGGVAIDARADDVSRGGFAPALWPVRQEPVGASLVRIPVQQVRE